MPYLKINFFALLVKMKGIFYLLALSHWFSSLIVKDSHTRVFIILWRSLDLKRFHWMLLLCKHWSCHEGWIIFLKRIIKLKSIEKHWWCLIFPELMDFRSWYRFEIYFQIIETITPAANGVIKVLSIILCAKIDKLLLILSQKHELRFILINISY